MKTLKGPPGATGKYEFTCRGCQAGLKAEPGDGRRETDGEGPAVVFTCPHCKHETWVAAGLVPWR